MLQEDHITELEHYFVPVVDKYTTDSLEIVFNSIKVRKLYLPAPETDDEFGILDKITDLASYFRVEVVACEPSYELTVGEYTVSLRERNYVKNSFVLTLSREDLICTYLSRGSLEYCVTASSYLFATDTVIFGNTGPNYKTVYAVDEYGESLERVIICAKSIYFDTRFLDYEPQILTDEAVILIY